MIRLTSCFLATLSLMACAVTTPPEKTVIVSMTHSNEMTLPAMAAETASQQPQMIRCEKFLSSIALAEQKTAHMYQGYAL